MLDRNSVLRQLHNQHSIVNMEIVKCPGNFNPECEATLQTTFIIISRRVTLNSVIKHVNETIQANVRSIATINSGMIL